MIKLGKVDNLFVMKSNRMPFDEIKRRFKKPHQFYIYQIINADFTYIQILVNLSQEVIYIKFRMANQTLIAYLRKTTT